MKPAIQKQREDFVLVEWAKYSNGSLFELYNRRHFTALKWQEFLQSERKKPEAREVYDKYGNLIEVEYYRDDHFVSCHSYEYDDYQHVISDCFFQMDVDLETETKTYYDKNHRTTQINFKRYQFVSKVFFEYDHKDRCSKVTSRQICNPEQLGYMFSYVYDREKLKEEKCYGNHGQIVWTSQFIYDRKNCLTEKNVYDKKGTLFCIIEIHYDGCNCRIDVQKFVHKKYLQEWSSGENAVLAWWLFKNFDPVL